MKTSESKIKQTFDIGNDELDVIDNFKNKLRLSAQKKGYLDIETSLFEDKARYLNATSIHFSKIFNVERPKEKSRYVLQSDLAMSMSRFIADNWSHSGGPVKLQQNGYLFRDRVDNKPGYRRIFQQYLLGIWGMRNKMMDAEMVLVIYETLRKLGLSGSFRLQVSNHNLLNNVNPKLAELIRFNTDKDKRLDILKTYSEISDNDIENIFEILNSDGYDIYELQRMRLKLTNSKLISAIDETLDFISAINKINPIINTRTIFNNLDGTNHYSGLTFRIYYTDQNRKETLVADGGRMDTMVKKFNSQLDIPASVFGVGTQILAQLIMSENPNRSDDIKKILILTSPKNHMQGVVAQQALSSKNNFVSMMMLDSKKQISKVLKSDFYRNFVFIVCQNNKIDIRNTNDINKKILRKRLDEIIIRENYL